MNIVVREAGDDDAALIAGLTRAAWAGKVAASSSGHHETAGSLRFMPLDSEPAIWEISRMGILPAWRGNHCSQHLLEAVIHHALSCQAEELRLAVRLDQGKLIDFYAAFGFELAEELEYSHANPFEPPPSVMRRMLRY